MFIVEKQELTAMTQREKNITFLIGNGFDVGMGMKSQYSDFYKVYTQPDSPYFPDGGENDLVRELRAAVEEQLPHWSYYEKWFGKLTIQYDEHIIKGEKTEEIREILLTQNEEFQKKFYKYLIAQEAALVVKGNSNQQSLESFRKIFSGHSIDAVEAANLQKCFGKLVDVCDEAMKKGEDASDFSKKCQDWGLDFLQNFTENQKKQKSEPTFEERVGSIMLDGIRCFYSRDNIDDGETAVVDALNKNVDYDLAAKRNYRFVCFNYSSVIDRCVAALVAEREKRYKRLIGKVKRAYTKGKIPVFSAKDLKNLSAFMPEYHEKVLSCIKDYGDKCSKNILCPEEAKESCEEFLEQWFDAEKFQAVHHGHGALSEAEHSVLVMGVNDGTQIGEAFGEDQNKSYSNRLIKKQIMSKKPKQYETTTEMINSSDVIVVYGMSIGDTDKDYWADIYKWLKGDTSRQLIFYMYDSSYEPLSPNNLKQIVTNYMKQFRDMTWRLDEEVEWCDYSKKKFCFSSGICTKSQWCTRELCDGHNLAQWCAANGLGSSDSDAKDKLCEMTCCPEYERCKEWIEIRKRIHFAIHKNIFSLK